MVDVHLWWMYIYGGNTFMVEYFMGAYMESLNTGETVRECENKNYYVHSNFISDGWDKSDAYDRSSRFFIVE